MSLIWLLAIKKKKLIMRADVKNTLLSSEDKMSTIA